MDGRRFDGMTAALAARGTRRGVVAAIAAALLGAGVSEREAAAGRLTCRHAGASCTRATQCCSGLCQRGPGSRRNRCACPDGLELCAGGCRDLTADRNNCGACGVACTGSDGCFDGACSECGDTLWNRQNCGGCGIQCSGNDVCTNGECTGCDDYAGDCWVDVNGLEWGGRSNNSIPERLPCDTNEDCAVSLNCDDGVCYCLVEAFTDYGNESWYTASPRECGVLLDYPVYAR